MKFHVCYVPMAKKTFHKSFYIEYMCISSILSIYLFIVIYVVHFP